MAECTNFEEWLCCRLKQIGLDDEVFGSYVTGVMDADDSTNDDRKDALVGILDGTTEHPVEDLCSEILQRWASSRDKVIKERQEAKEQKTAEKQNKLAEIMEKQASTVNAAKSNLAKVDKDLKEKLLAEYSHHSDEEHSDNGSADTLSQGATDVPSFFKNTNTQGVLEREKEKKEKLRNESEQKKQQIKEAREKQKQNSDDRKEKEKKRTQKGERRTR